VLRAHHSKGVCEPPISAREAVEQGANRVMAGAVGDVL